MERRKLQRFLKQGHTGWWDNLFGKRIVMNVPNLDGTTRRASVTESWRALMIAEGVLQLEVVPVHIKDLDYEIYRLLPESLRPQGMKGPRYTEEWNLRRKGISSDVLSSFYDAETQALYAVRHTMDPEKGPVTNLVQKSMWNAM